MLTVCVINDFSFAPPFSQSQYDQLDASCREALPIYTLNAGVQLLNRFIDKNSGCCSRMPISIIAEKQQLGRTEMMTAVEHVMNRSQAALFVKALRDSGVLRRDPLVGKAPKHDTICE